MRLPAGSSDFSLCTSTSYNVPMGHCGDFLRHAAGLDFVVWFTIVATVCCADPSVKRRNDRQGVAAEGYSLF